MTVCSLERLLSFLHVRLRPDAWSLRFEIKGKPTDSDSGTRAWGQAHAHVRAGKQEFHSLPSLLQVAESVDSLRGKGAPKDLAVPCELPGGGGALVIGTFRPGGLNVCSPSPQNTSWVPGSSKGGPPFHSLVPRPLV